MYQHVYIYVKNSNILTAKWSLLADCNAGADTFYWANLTFSGDDTSNYAFHQITSKLLQITFFILIFATLTLTLLTFTSSRLTGIFHPLIPPVILLFTWCCQPSYTFTVEPCQQFEATLLHAQHSCPVNDGELWESLEYINIKGNKLFFCLVLLWMLPLIAYGYARL